MSANAVRELPPAVRRAVRRTAARVSAAVKGELAAGGFGAPRLTAAERQAAASDRRARSADRRTISRHCRRRGAAAAVEARVGEAVRRVSLALLTGLAAPGRRPRLTVIDGGRR